jgi:hypothetical protein
MASAVPGLFVVSSLALALSVPWSDGHTFEASISVRSGALRRATAEREVIAHLRHRPADAEAWLVLAWLRAPEAPSEAADLAPWATRLDPTEERLTAAAGRIRAGGAGRR